MYRKRHKNQQKHLIKENQHRPPRCCFEMVNNNNKLKERGVSFFVPLMKKGEYLVWFLCVFFNVGGGSSSRVSVGFHRQALSSKRATSLVHQTQRKYCGLVSFALLVTTVSFRNQSVIAVAVEQEIEGVRGGSCCGPFI